jgi:RNA polymerase sigma-70 factor (ECF subfamily)
VGAEHDVHDRARLAAVVAGGAGAFACVAAAWQAHEAELRGYLRHRVGDDATADDILQDVFVKAMRQGRGFCVLDNPRAWLFQVARNAIVDRLRETRTSDELPDDLPAPAPEPVAPVDALTGCLTRVLGELPAADAGILRACDLEGQTVNAFAVANGLGLAAAKSRLRRARQRLRDRLTAACQVRFDADGIVCGYVPRPSPQEPGSIA